MFSTDDTIAAIASAAGNGLRGIVRVSGPDVLPILQSCFESQPPVSLCDIVRSTALEGQILTPSLGPLPCRVLFWPTQRSYTRQPSAEVHTFSSPPLLSALLARLVSAGARPARPGEFTLRAFLAQRIDLTQAEAVLGVVSARSETDLAAALAQLAGGLARPLAAVREELLELLAHLEAGLDFVDEDIEFIAPADLKAGLDRALSQLYRLTAQLAQRQRSDDAGRVVLCGLPNVGKSSLFNALAGQPLAIVAGEPGTTRDYLTARIEHSGQDFFLVDTAGLAPEASQPDADHPSASLQRQAQSLAAGQHTAGEVLLVCLDASRPLAPQERALLSESAMRERIIVLTKGDLPSRVDLPPGVASDVATSTATGQGLRELRQLIAAFIARTSHDAAPDPAGAAERCRASVERACESLERAAELVSETASHELVAAEIRCGLDFLGEVTGEVCTDEILDRIFSRFCIGK